jgi:hypothetical protein
VSNVCIYLFVALGGLCLLLLYLLVAKLDALQEVRCDVRRLEDMVDWYRSALIYGSRSQHIQD